MGTVRALAARRAGQVGTLLESVKFEHTVFALPFAYLGMVLAARGLPSASQVLWITLAMVGARTLAMACNRLIDRRIDALNPRTAGRALPTGRLTPWQLVALAGLSAFVLSFATWQLNELCFKLAPLAVLIVIGYSYTKRFTWLTHFFLGLADGIAPVGGWLAVTGKWAWEPFILATAVGFWIAGFDLIYACQDVAFDRAHGIHSVPARFGVATALRLSTFAHALTTLLLLALGVYLSLGPAYYVGWGIAVGLLIYEHRLVRPNDLSRLDVAFFNVNGYIAMVVFAFTLAGIYL